jgi:hypothetical protein
MEKIWLLEVAKTTSCWLDKFKTYYVNLYIFCPYREEKSLKLSAKVFPYMSLGKTGYE